MTTDDAAKALMDKVHRAVVLQRGAEIASHDNEMLERMTRFCVDLATWLNEHPERQAIVVALALDAAVTDITRHIYGQMEQHHIDGEVETMLRDGEPN